MSNIIPFEESAVPAHVARAFGGQSNSDLSSGVSVGFPIISYKGKVWHVVEGENRTLVANADGEPRSSLEVVIMKSNPHISKVYYEGGYEEGSSAKPTCYSHDGLVPAADSAKLSPKCGICPNNAWGSKVTEQGAKGKLCSDSRRLAVAPAGELDRAMLLRVPAGSLKELVAYADMLARRQTPYQAVVTKVAFDHTVAHQKLKFSPVRWLNEDEIVKVAEMVDSELVKTIVGNDQFSAVARDDFQIEGERPQHQLAQAVTPEQTQSKVREAARATEAEVAKIIEPVIAPKPAPKADGFSSMVAEANAAADAEAAVQPTPVTVRQPVKEQVLLEEADDELTRILAGLDD